jgi:hypothetical protein
VDAIHVASLDGDLVYAKMVDIYGTPLDPADDVEVWYYFDGTIVRGTVYATVDGDGNNVYWMTVAADECAAYQDDDGSIWLYDGTTWVQYGPFDYKGESIFISNSFKSMLPGTLALIDAWSAEGTDDKFGTIKSIVSGHAEIQKDAGSYIETASITAYRNSPDYAVDFSSTEPDFLNAWGSSLFNLDGAVYLDSNVLTHETIGAYVQTLCDNLRFIASMSDTMFSTSVDSFLGESASWTDDQWLDFVHSSDRFTIISENMAVDVDALDFATDPRVVDMTGIYDTGNAGSTIKVIPMLLDTRYLGIYDMASLSGWGLASTAAMPLNHFLVEVWQEVKTDLTVNYYVNASFNYIDWWYTAEPGAPLHVTMPNNFDLHLSYLDESVDPETIMLDSIRAIPDVLITESAADTAIVPSIGIIIYPVKVQVGDEANFTVGIVGETIGKIKYRIDSDPTEHDFQVTYDFFINNVPQPHWGKRASTNVIFAATGTHTFTVVVYDTKNSVTAVDVKSASISVTVRTADIYAWVAAIIVTIFGMFGIAVVKNKRMGRGKNCIGGACNI